jgi:hypothetical protein
METHNLIHGIGILFLLPAIYFFTTNPGTQPYGFHLFAVCLLFLLSYFLFKKKQKLLLSYLSAATVFSLVGMTGWFSSPLFYLLYILAISLAFIFDTVIPFLMSVSLVILFLPTIAKGDLIVNAFTFFSISILPPLAHYLRTEYLSLKENQKKILILEESHSKYKNKLENVLSNKISRFIVSVKEPINDIKQLSYVLSKSKDPKIVDKKQEKIISLADTALSRLSEFEEKTTGSKLIKMKE